MCTTLRGGVTAAALAMVTLLALAFDRPAGSVPPRPSLGIPAVGDQQSPTVAFDGMDYLVVWDDARAGERDIFGARVSRDGIVLDEGGFSISREPGSQGGPFVASGTGTSLVVWTDTRAGQLDTYGARVSQSGQVLDPAGISIATSSLYREWSHGLAFDGSRFLAMWWLSDPNNAWYNAMEGRLVSQAGTVGPFIQVDAGSYPQYTPSPAFGETNYLVGWVRYNAYADIYARRVTPDGAVLDPGGIPVGVSPDGDFSPALAFGLGQFLVVWDRGPADEATRRIFGARVTESGTVLDEDGLPISAGPEDRNPAIAFDGANFLVAWASQLGDISAARVAPDGTVLDPEAITISDAAGDQGSVSLAADGSGYFLVWGDHRGSDWDIYGARVTPEGEVLDPGGILISN